MENHSGPINNPYKLIPIKSWCGDDKCNYSLQGWWNYEGQLSGHGLKWNYSLPVQALEISIFRMGNLLADGVMELFRNNRGIFGE